MSRQRWVAALVFATAVMGGCGADSAAEPSRQYPVELRAEDSGEEYAFVAEQALDLRVGDRVTFRMRNAGALPHDLQVLAPDGKVVATAAAVGPGQMLELTVDFSEAGYFRLNCNVDDHLTRHGMQAIVQVTEPQ